VKSEPVLVAGSIVGLVEAVIVMCVAMGWLRVDETQLATILAVVVATSAALTPLVGAIWARSKVTPVHKPVDRN
jgi:hypothetical protein